MKFRIILVFLVATGLLLVSSMSLISHLHHYQAKKFIQTWSIDKSASSSLIDRTYYSIEQARRWSPYPNPALDETSGLFYEWQAVWSSEPEQALDFYTKALADYQRQSGAVPDWPYPWINQLRIIYRITEIAPPETIMAYQSQWQQAWQQAVFFAQHHSLVSLALARELNSFWPYLNQLQRQEALMIMVNSVAQSPSHARQLMRGISVPQFKAAVCLTLRAQQYNDYGQCTQ